MAKRVFLVTGAAGFVGANVCRRLAERNEEVHIFVKHTTDLWRLEDLKPGLHVHEVDVCDERRVDERVAAIRPTVVYHLATHGAYARQSDADTILLVNVFGLWNLLQACNKHGYELFVNTGSSSEYGRKAFAMRETDLLEPDSYYAVAKSAQSLLARLTAQLEHRPVVTLRLFSVYGPYEQPGRLMPTLMMAALHDQPIDMVDPQTARDFVYVDDVVDVYLNVDRLKPVAAEVLNVGTGVQSTMTDVVETTQSLTGKTLQVRWGAMPPRPWDSSVWVADVTKLRRLAGLCPRTTLREGIAKCLPWFKDHAGLYRSEG